MLREVSSMRSISIVASFLVAMAAMASPAAVRAECTGAIYFPPFKEVVRSARVVVIGVVDRNFNKDIGDRGSTPHARVRVTETVRGPAYGFIRIKEWPALNELGCGEEWLYVRIGWRVALALDGFADGASGRVNAIAYLDHDPDPSGKEIGIPRLTDQQVRSLALLPDTATAKREEGSAATAAIIGTIVPLLPAVPPSLMVTATAA